MFFDDSASKDLDTDIANYVGLSLGATEDVETQNILKKGLRAAYIGSTKKPTGNVYDEDQLQDMISGMFPNGASFSVDQKFYPKGFDTNYREVDPQEALDVLREEDFGTVFPAFPLKDDVVDWAAGQSGAERVIEMLQAGEADLVPQLDVPGAFMVRFQDETVLPPRS